MMWEVIKDFLVSIFLVINKKNIKLILVINYNFLFFIMFIKIFCYCGIKFLINIRINI